MHKPPYTEKLVDLSQADWKDLKEKLAQDLIICRTCCRWVQQTDIHIIPNRYRGFITGYSPELLQYIPESKIPVEGCIYCISDAVRRRKHLVERERIKHELLASPHIQTHPATTHLGSGLRGTSIPKETNQTAGYTYVARHKDRYKIGSTMRSVASRLREAGYDKTDFIHAIQSHAPRTLEVFLHMRFQEVHAPESSKQELFRLSREDLDYIKAIVTLNGRPVTHHTDVSTCQKIVDG